jgi:hypothetical protein
MSHSEIESQESTKGLQRVLTVEQPVPPQLAVS